MKDSAKYVKIVEWSEEDQCYVGSAPGLMLGGCHGSDEKEVFEDLCQAVEKPLSCTRMTARLHRLQLRVVILPPRCKMSHSLILTATPPSP